MTKKKLRFGALPKRQMPRKSHQSSQPTPRHERSVVKDVVEISASTSFYSTFQEFSQRAKNLKTICDWMSKFSVDKAVFKKLEGYKLCNGVQALELTSKLFHHVVPINHDTVSEHEEEEAEEKEQQQFPHKGFWRAKGCLLIQEQGEACCVCTTYALIASH